MPATLNKKPLWSYREVAEILGLGKNHGFRTVSELVRAHEIEIKKTSNAKQKALNRDDVNFLAKLLNKTVAWPNAKAQQ